MKIQLNQNNNPATDTQDCVVIPVFNNTDRAVLSQSGKLLDDSCRGAISAILDKGDFKGKLETTTLLYDLSGCNTSRILLMGCGSEEEFDTKSLNKVIQSVCKAIKDTSITSIALYLSTASTDAIQQTVIAFENTLYCLDNYKSKKQDPFALETIALSNTESWKKNTETALKYGQAIANGMKVARDLANHPGNVCTPTFIAETAAEISSSYSNIDIEVLEESDMEKLGMGSFLSVSKGSDEPGKMIVLQYFGTDKSEAPIALVGKGVTFDTGGISLKPGAKMDEMKFDMGGAAGMLGTLKSCAEMGLALNLVVVLAAAENMPSARATKPGDIVTSMKGITIEVLNTDAEGRLVLCDALTYVGKFKPRLVIDAATLTGACIVALGHHISAVLSNDDGLVNDLQAAGNTINDPIWRLPMNDEYKKQLKSALADLGNIGGPAAGTITAACFLGEFTKDYKWAHLDIAGTAWDGKDATGRPVPLLSQFLINQIQKTS